MTKYKTFRTRVRIALLAMAALALSLPEGRAGAAGPVITSLPAQVVVGDSLTIAGSGFSKGSVVNLFVATAGGAIKFGPFTPTAQSATSLTIDVPATVTLGQGVVAAQVINTDEGFAASNAVTAQLFGNPGDGFPNLTAIDGVGLAATSTEPDFAADNVETVVIQGLKVVLTGNGFDTTNGVAVDLFCACPGGKVGPFLLNPGDSGLTAGSITFTLPASGANTPVTGPGSFVISNKGSDGTYSRKSNAVSVPIGAPMMVTGVSQTGCTVTVDGGGFSPLTVLNLFNRQSGGAAVNLGGIAAGGSARIPITVVSPSQLTFGVPAALVSGASYVQAINPPFVPYTSSGTSPAGAFTAEACVAPAISSLAPSSAVAGGPALVMTVNGEKFASSAMVRWNGQPLPTTFVSGTKLQATIPASDIAKIGSARITVSNPPGATSGASTFFTGTIGGDGFAEVVLNQQANDLVFDPVHQVIYLSVPGAAATNPNTIAVIDLATASIKSSKFAGSEPNVLAISDDSRFLYAGIDGAASVRRFLLPTLATDITWYLGADSFFGPYYALDLQVAPGAPYATAVTLAVSGESPAAQGGITIFDDGKARPTTAPGFGGGPSSGLFDSLQWGSNDTELFAANNEDTGFDFYTLKVDSSGVTLDQDYPSAFTQFFKRIHFDPGTGFVYNDDGQVVDPSNGHPVGRFPVSGIMVPDSTLNRAFFVSGLSSIAVDSFNQAEFTSTGSITPPGVTGNPQRLIRWGDNGLAFITDSGQVVLIGGNFVH